MAMTKALENIIAYAVEAAKPDMVILFGSFASGKNNLYSDVDLLIVSNQVYKRQELAAQISSVAKEYALQADVLIHTPEELKKAAAQPFSFLHSIVQAGKIVYKKPG